MSLLHRLPRVTVRRKRVGRGVGSGRGVTATRGTKGQHARAGWRHRAGFEGGQTPLYMRLPKGRGTKQRFSSQVRKPSVVTISQLAGVLTDRDVAVVGPRQLHAHGLVGHRNARVKLIGSGELSRQVTVRVHALSPAARASIEAAGGSIEVLSS